MGISRGATRVMFPRGLPVVFFGWAGRVGWDLNSSRARRVFGRNQKPPPTRANHVFSLAQNVAISARWPVAYPFPLNADIACDFAKCLLPTSTKAQIDKGCPNSKEGPLRQLSEWDLLWRYTRRFNLVCNSAIPLCAPRAIVTETEVSQSNWMGGRIAPAAENAHQERVNS